MRIRGQSPLHDNSLFRIRISVPCLIDNLLIWAQAKSVSEPRKTTWTWMRPNKKGHSAQKLASAPSGSWDKWEAFSDVRLFFWWVTADRKKGSRGLSAKLEKFSLKAILNKLRFLRFRRAAKLSILRKIGEVAFPRGKTFKDKSLRRWQEKKH